MNLFYITIGIVIHLAGATKYLYIAGFYSGGDRWDGTGMRPAVELAVEHVNEQCILDGYELHVRWKDSMCLSSGGIWSFHRHLVEEPQNIILLGPACSTATEPVAETSQYANLLTISYSAASPTLSDRQRHPYFFRTYPSELLTNPTRTWLFETFNWKRFGVLYENEDLFILTHQHLSEVLEQANLSVEYHGVLIKSPSTDQLQIMKGKDLRIFILLAYEDAARETFCKIYQTQMYGKGYVWILPGWYSNQWWRTSEPIGGCTSEEIETAVVESMYICMEPHNVTQTNRTIVSGITVDEFKESLEDARNQYLNFTLSGLEPFGYDALWAVANALNQSMEVLTKDNRSLEDFSYNNKDIGNVLFNAMSNTQFDGLSGPVSFSGGDRVHGIIRIEQLQGGCKKAGWLRFKKYCYKFLTNRRDWISARTYCIDEEAYLVSVMSEDELDFLRDQGLLEWWIGLTHNESFGLVWVDTVVSVTWLPENFEAENKQSCYVLAGDSGTWKSVTCTQYKAFICKTRIEYMERPIVMLSSNNTGSLEPTWHEEYNFSWPDGEIPPDRTPASEDGLAALGYSFVAIFACLGIIMALCFLLFNVLYEKHCFVKLSSPRVNNLILVGSILIYLSINFIGMDIVKRDANGEKPRSFCMLRIWFMSIGFVLGFGAIFIKTWRVYKLTTNSQNFKSVKINDTELFYKIAILVVVDFLILLVWQAADPLKYKRLERNTAHYIQICSCNVIYLWTSLLLLFKGLMLVFGVFLAWQTRKITIKGLNDSKLIGICIYNTFIAGMLAIAFIFAFEDNTAAQHLLISFLVIICVSVTLIFVFVPKVVYVYKYPKADRRSVVLSANAPPHAFVISSNNANDVDNADAAKESSIKKLLQFMTGFDRPQSYYFDAGSSTENPKPTDTSTEIPTTSMYLNKTT